MRSIFSAVIERGSHKIYYILLDSNEAVIKYWLDMWEYEINQCLPYHGTSIVYSLSLYYESYTKGTSCLSYLHV